MLVGLRQYVLHAEIEDRVSWKLTRDGVFSVRSLYQAL